MSRGEKIFLMVVVITVVTVLLLIRPDPKSAKWLASPSPVDWENVEDDPSEKLSIEWLGIIANPGGRPGSWIERMIEERFNIDINPIFIDANTYQKRLPLMLVGGDVPDVMWAGDPLTVRANLHNGFIMEVPYEVLLKHCPNYVRMVNAYGKEAWLYAHYIGRNFGLPTVSAGAARPRLGSWRMDWLKRVGIDKVPETVDEMHEAFRRFRYNDPDGNGQKDTYGWFPNIYHWSLVFAEVFAAYDVLAFEFMQRDGKIVWGGLLPETKEALRTLQTWYKEDLLDPDFVLDAQGRLGEMKFINGKVGYMYPVDHPFFYMPEEEGSLWGKALAFDSRAELAPGPPLKNKEGERRGRTWGGAAHVMQFGRQLEQEPEKVIRVLKMIEAIASDEALYNEVRRGELGRQWDVAKEAFRKPNGKMQKPGFMLLPPFDDESYTRANVAELIGGVTTFFFPSSFEPEYDDKIADPADLAWYERYAKREWGMKNVLGKSDVVPSAGRYLADLVNYQMTFFIEIVIGDRDIEEFEAFVAEWRRRGGDVLLKEANEMYAEFRRIYETVGAGENGP